MPPKGILKKDGKLEKKSIVWDENVIARHDLERGGRMKIDEPKTPFIHYSIETDTLHGTSRDPPPMALVEAVQGITIEAQAEHSDWSSGDELDDAKDKDQDERKLELEKKKEFDRKRRLHYKMGEALKHK